MKCSNRVWCDLDSYINRLCSLPIDLLTDVDWLP
jgi:hypothetical protein